MAVRFCKVQRNEKSMHFFNFSPGGDGAFDRQSCPGGGEFNHKKFQKFKCPGGCPGGMIKLRFDRCITYHSQARLNTEQKNEDCLRCS